MLSFSEFLKEGYRVTADYKTSKSGRKYHPFRIKTGTDNINDPDNQDDADSTDSTPIDLKNQPSTTADGKKINKDTKKDKKPFFDPTWS